MTACTTITVCGKCDVFFLQCVANVTFPFSCLLDFDVPGTIITSASVTSQTSLLNAAVLQSFDASNKLYHLIKPDTGEGESKIVSEVFLTRLLSTKVQTKCMQYAYYAIALYM